MTDEMESAQQDRPRVDRGFTLIELLIVIVILGILSTIVVLSVRGITDQGRASACQADTKSLEGAYEAAVAKGDVIPPAAGTTMEQALVAAGLMRTVSTKHELDTNGDIFPQDPDCGAVGGAATSATGGTPGSWNGLPPASLAVAPSLAPVPAWSSGQFVYFADNSAGHWNGAAWAAGPKP